MLNHYVSAGWLKQPTRGVYRRPRGALSWQQGVISLQTILSYPLLVYGARRTRIRPLSGSEHQTGSSLRPQTTAAVAEQA
ncbi:AbiEi antitoxin N-terminal domain-containing protein [Bradyrhizobium huanghuaihaiense]|uniref:AbiEi antitoxin N-terminal domain-containing protein n=1 Tax=Bradyrhizobium huanghuaihaiense TaxID=990078 RepID=UPI0021AA5C9B|nr:AbiEi antitoxin N-terminal domain-containing protein [Bradyrhizobium sp. CB3035]UWU78307.1 AbiEi antitoxin N-terminal domain-containing protein [Bradyrhizobium sp. CB3035]